MGVLEQTSPIETNPGISCLKSVASSGALKQKQVCDFQGDLCAAEWSDHLSSGDNSWTATCALSVLGYFPLSKHTSETPLSQRSSEYMKYGDKEQGNITPSKHLKSSRAAFKDC